MREREPDGKPSKAFVLRCEHNWWMSIWPYSADEVAGIVGLIAERMFGVNHSLPVFLARGSNNAAYLVKAGAEEVVIRVTGEWREQSTVNELWCYHQAEELGIPGPHVRGLGKLEKLPYIAMSFVEGE